MSQLLIFPLTETSIVSPIWSNITGPYLLREQLISERGQLANLDPRKVLSVYEDVFKRDEFASRLSNTELIYVIVAVNNNSYQGHVYAWISSFHTLLIMGIRKTLFSEGDKVKITPILMEGCRQLALSLGLSQMSAVMPYAYVSAILLNRGFVYDESSQFKIGDKSIAYPDGYMENDWYWLNTYREISNP